VAAIRAAQLGARVTVVERQAVGGVCLNYGCIPSKALLAAVELRERFAHAEGMGLKVEGAVSFDLARMVARKNTVVDGLVKGIGALFKAWNIELREGGGTLLDERTVEVTHRTGERSRVTADAVILATGSSWPEMPLFPVDGRRIITSKEALDQTYVPARVLIVGGGVEGCEFAAYFSGIGSQVTVVELLPRLLPLEDEEISLLLDRALRKRGVAVRTGTAVATLTPQTDATVRVELRDGTVLTVDQILVSVGRGFNSRRIGLERVGVQTGPRGEVVVDDRLETTVPGVYAIGDVTGKAMLAHVASAQGKVAVENIVRGPRDMAYDVVPAGIFTLPEIGRVGLTEQQARQRVAACGGSPETAIKVGRFRYGGLGKAQAVGETAGLFKIVSEAGTGRILGAHMFGAHAADLIHEVAMAMQVGATVSDVGHLIHAHPTFSEGVMEAAEDVEGAAIHMARKRA
jgi:dihydrolipoamide dehydrogenase